MRFPRCLETKGRTPYPEHKINLKNYMYARHKPGYDWNPDEEFPDFSKISSYQSFNWSAFSIPVWVRFNDQKEYKKDYGVIGYSVNTIRNIHIIDKTLPLNSYGIKHKPEEFNFSHSELYPLNITKKHKRIYRLNLKHKCQKKILPYSNVSRLRIFFDYFIMLKHRLLVFFSNN